MLTHLNAPLWIVSSGSLRRWKWPLWWTLCRTVSPRSPSAGSACSLDQPARSCICHRRTPQPRQESASRAFFHLTAGLRCTGRVSRAPPQIWSLLQILLVLFSVRRVLLQPVESNAVEQNLVSSSCSLCSPCPNLCAQPQPSPSPSPSHTRHLDGVQWRTWSYSFIVVILGECFHVKWECAHYS